MSEGHEDQGPGFRIRAIPGPGESSPPSIPAIHPELRPPLWTMIPDIAAQLQELIERFPYLSESLLGSMPCYCLPDAMIKALRVRAPHQQFSLTRNQVNAEFAFTASCGSFAIGVWERRWINSQCFVDRPQMSSDTLREAGFTPAHLLSAARLMDRTDKISLKLRGYVGWLVTDPTFIEDCNRLRQLWNTLPKGDRPSFPLSRPIAPPTAELDVGRVDHGIENFQSQLRTFLDHWGLTGLETWDLPCPQGPLLPALMAPTSPAMPHHGVHIVLPVHYPLTTDDEIFRFIRGQQRRLASEEGLDATLASLEHHEVYAQMFAVQHLERAVRSRYEQGNSGIVGAVENAMAVTLGLKIDYIRKLRSGISALRRGKRSSITWLRQRTC